MARPKPWIGDIPRIINALESQPPTTMFDRRDVETMFGISRTQANELMKIAGVSKKDALRGAALVSQADLLNYIRHSPQAQGVEQEQARRAKLVASLEAAAYETKLRKVSIPVTSADGWCDLSKLPNVAIESGVLRVAFSSPLELMADLYRLCKAAGNDWGRFERLCRSAATSGKDEAA